MEVWNHFQIRNEVTIRQAVEEYHQQAERARFLKEKSRTKDEMDFPRWGKCAC